MTDNKYLTFNTVALRDAIKGSDDDESPVTLEGSMI